MWCYKGTFTLVILICAANWTAATIEEEKGTKKEDTKKEGGIEKDLLNKIASQACFNFFREQEEIIECKDTFLTSSSDISSDASELEFICRTKNTAVFAMPPKKERQLVAVVPNNSTGNVGTDILRNSQVNITVSYIDNLYNYTVWTTTLNNDGSHSAWSKGPALPPWNVNPIKYTIGQPSFEFDEENKKCAASFTIDMMGVINKCTTFNIHNSCNKQDLGWPDEQTIKPNVISNEAKQTVTVRDLDADDRCILELYNYDFPEDRYELEYATPTPKNTYPAKAVTNVTLDILPTELGWDVLVKWDRPEHDPLKYNVTLLAPGVFKSFNISGSETSYTFKGVSGKHGNPYNVTIYSIARNGSASSRPSRTVLGVLLRPTSYKAVIVTGSWSAVLTVAATAVGLFMWWRRRQALKNPIFPPGYFTPPSKEPKEYLMEFNPEIEADDSWELRCERIILHEVIGEGAFGVVRRGILSPGVKEVAVKMLKDFPTLEEIRSFRAEMELMKSVGAHPHIVSLVGCCSGKRPLIVAEYCSRGDLLSFLRCSWDAMVSKRNAKYYNNNLEGREYRNDLFKKQKDPRFPPLVVNRLYDLQGLCDFDLTALDLLSFCRQIAKGMEFLASNRVVHRDLAARNILVTGDRTLKIADFGLSRDVYQENQYKQKGNGKMPVKWMALESLTHRIYTTMSDVWSFGVVVWEVVTVGGCPYPEVTASRLPQILKAGYRMPRPNNCSIQLYELMLSCWRAKPRERPTFAELHLSLDDLLNSACADEYLSLEIDSDETPPTPKPPRYIKMLLRGNRVRARGENDERHLKGFQSNCFTTGPQPTCTANQQSNHYTTEPRPNGNAIQLSKSSTTELKANGNAIQLSNHNTGTPQVNGTACQQSKPSTTEPKANGNAIQLSNNNTGMPQFNGNAIQPSKQKTSTPQANGNAIQITNHNIGTPQSNGNTIQISKQNNGTPQANSNAIQPSQENTSPPQADGTAILLSNHCTATPQANNGNAIQLSKHNTDMPQANGIALQLSKQNTGMPQANGNAIQQSDHNTSARQVNGTAYQQNKQNTGVPLANGIAIQLITGAPQANGNAIQQSDHNTGMSQANGIALQLSKQNTGVPQTNGNTIQLSKHNTGMPQGNGNAIQLSKHNTGMPQANGNAIQLGNHYTSEPQGNGTAYQQNKHNTTAPTLPTPIFC